VEYMRNSRVYGASDFESVEKCLVSCCCWDETVLHC
jgi:hypothetical protein